jgi:hypothetical protein
VSVEELAEQAVCRTPIEIRRVTRLTRYGKKVTLTVLHVDEAHRRETTSSEYADIDSVYVGRIMVDEP